MPGNSFPASHKPSGEAGGPQPSHTVTQTRHPMAAGTRDEPEPPANDVHEVRPPFPSPAGPQGSPGQVDRKEVLPQQALVHQVIKDRRDPIGSQVWVSQAQDPIEFDMDEELAGLGGAQAEELVGVHQRCHLGTRRCREAWGRHWGTGVDPGEERGGSPGAGGVGAADKAQTPRHEGLREPLAF